MMRSIGAIALLWLVAVSPAAAEPLFGGWSGFYLGGHLGGAFGSSDWFDLGAGNIGSHNPSGIIGGGQIGYNFQLGPWVLGPQASLSGSSLGGSHLDAIFQFGAAPEHDRSRNDLLGTLTGRAGYVWGPLLAYGQGGAVWAHARYSLTGFFAPGLEFAVSDGEKWGWTAGAGLELGFAPGWSGFVEYDYLGFGSDVPSLKCTAVPDCGPPGKGAIGISIRENFHLLKTGLNFHF
jgi:outer membrane autotransporter protein